MSPPLELLLLLLLLVGLGGEVVVGEVAARSRLHPVVHGDAVVERVVELALEEEGQLALQALGATRLGGHLTFVAIRQFAAVLGIATVVNFVNVVVVVVVAVGDADGRRVAAPLRARLAASRGRWPFSFTLLVGCF